MLSITTLSPVILIVLVLLVFFSIGSWAIMIYKLVLINTVRKNSRMFTDFFWETREFALIDEKTPDVSNCPVARLFKEGYRETQHFLAAPPESGSQPRLSTEVGAIENISRSLRKITNQEMEKLEKDLSFLATTASTTPFIGLFGTVWGIMNAFQNIGQAGSTSLAIVAPGISEALVTTAIGLAAAIPAGIGYNSIQTKIRSLNSEIDSFSFDFLNMVQKILNTRK
jgi:biopolymer transport protein TolQ